MNPLNHSPGEIINMDQAATGAQDGCLQVEDIVHGT